MKITLNKNQIKSVDQAIQGGKSLYQNFKALLESDPVIRELFITKTPKEILEIVYGEECLSKPEFSLSIDRKRTPLGDCLHNLKKYTKKTYSEKANTSEKSDVKKYENVLKDLSNLATNFSSYKPNEQDSILNQIESLIRDINKALPKAKAIKIK